MALVVPFRALRPPAHLAPQVASPPYDVLDTHEARALADGNPVSFLHVARPEIDLDPSVDEHDDRVHRQGRDNLAKMEADGVLCRDPEPCLHLYRQQLGDHVQTGLVACVSVADYVSGRIRRHENTRADKEDDRTRHIDTLGAHDEPVFLTYRAAPRIDAFVRARTEGTPAYDFTTSDGVRHVFWSLSPVDSALVTDLFAGDVGPLYIADGHHRSAAAARVHAQRNGQSGEHGVFPAVLFPHDQMNVLAYNRVVRDRARRDTHGLLEVLGSVFALDPSDAPIPPGPRAFTFFVEDRWWIGRVRPGTVDERDPVASLDCSILQDQLLAPVFGIGDPRTDDALRFVGGIRGPGELERLVRERPHAFAVHLHPTSVEQLIAVSDAGLLMPPKSTWFEPKLRSGLFVHTL